MLSTGLVFELEYGFGLELELRLELRGQLRVCTQHGDGPCSYNTDGLGLCGVPAIGDTASNYQLTKDIQANAIRSVVATE